MPDAFTQTLREWQNFYFMMGSASATLVGLMFVAVSLGADLPSAANTVGINIFVTPMLMHFVSVLIIAAVMLVPSFHAGSVLAVTILIIGVVFGMYACRVGWQFTYHPDSAGYTRRDWK